VEIVMANTGIVANTEKAVAGVRERKQKNPEKYDKIFKEAEELAYMARKALSDYNLRTVGELMNKNHQQLQAIEVSNKELDSLVELAYENGAFGAKMTGGGLGGNIVALTPGRGLQDQVARAIKKEGFEVLMTRIG
jgi:mevalonate kinase